MSEIGRGNCNVGRWYVIVGDADSLLSGEASCTEGVVISKASYECGRSFQAQAPDGSNQCR